MKIRIPALLLFLVHCSATPLTGTTSDFGRLALARFKQLLAGSGTEGIPRSEFQNWMSEMKDILDENGLLVPNELALIQLLAFRRVHFACADCLEILSRMIKPLEGENSKYVYKFKQILTLEALMFEQESLVHTQDHQDIALPELPGYFRTSKVSRNDRIGSFTAIAGTGNQIHAKFWLGNYDSFPFTIVWESAVLDVLDGIHGIPKERRLKYSPFMSNTSRQRLLVTDIPHLSVPISNYQSSLTWKRMARIALQGISILKAIHSRGFIHGAVGDNTLRINQITGEVFFVDFSSATPWTDSSLQPVPREEPLSDKSVFQLEGNPPSRRDDLIRFAELVLRVSGEPSFAQSGEKESSFSAKETAQLKRKRKLTSNHQTPFVFVLFYLAAIDLSPDVEPPYDQWINGFKKILD